MELVKFILRTVSMLAALACVALYIEVLHGPAGWSRTQSCLAAFVLFVVSGTVGCSRSSPRGGNHHKPTL